MQLRGFGKAMTKTALIPWVLLLLAATTACSKQPEPVEAPVVTAEAPSAAQYNPGAVFEAALEGNLAFVQGALDDGFDVNQTNADQQTLLMLASFNGHTELCRLLIARGAIVDARDYKYSTPLMFAASGPFPATVQLLLEAGADPNAVDRSEGFTALMHAAAEGQLEVVKLLLEHGADRSIRDVDEDTAETFARQNGHLQVADYIRDFQP